MNRIQRAVLAQCILLALVVCCRSNTPSVQSKTTDILSFMNFTLGDTLSKCLIMAESDTTIHNLRCEDKGGICKVDYETYIPDFNTPQNEVLMYVTVFSFRNLIYSIEIHSHSFEGEFLRDMYTAKYGQPQDSYPPKWVFKNAEIVFFKLHNVGRFNRLEGVRDCGVRYTDTDLASLTHTYGRQEAAYYEDIRKEAVKRRADSLNAIQREKEEKDSIRRSHIVSNFVY